MIKNTIKLGKKNSELSLLVKNILGVDLVDSHLLISNLPSGFADEASSEQSMNLQKTREIVKTLFCKRQYSNSITNQLQRNKSEPKNDHHINNNLNNSIISNDSNFDFLRNSNISRFENKKINPA